MTVLDDWKSFAPEPKPLSGDQKWNVFLSYRSVNRPWVLNLYDVLREAGHTVFLDQCVLKAGDQLIRTLEDALDQTQCGVLVWSSESRDSEWVRKEYEVMESRATEDPEGFQFVPLRLDSDDLPRFARNRVFLDFSSYPDGPNGGELLRLLHSVVAEPLSNDAARFASDQDEEARTESARIGAAIRNGNAARLVELFEANGLAWQTSAGLGCRAAEGLTRLDRCDDALAMLDALIQRFPKTIRPKQLKALALARRGEGSDLADAQSILGVLYELGERDPETLGIYARTWMDRYEQSGSERELRQSRDLYAEAFDSAHDDYYTGINAAAKSVFLGDQEALQRAAGLAERVEAIVGTEPHPNDYWMTATVAEVQLIKKSYEAAGRMYEAAVAMAPAEVGSHRSTWKQARRLMAALAPSDEERALVGKPFQGLPDDNNG